MASAPEKIPIRVRPDETLVQSGGAPLFPAETAGPDSAPGFRRAVAEWIAIRLNATWLHGSNTLRRAEWHDDVLRLVETGYEHDAGYQPEQIRPDGHGLYRISHPWEWAEADLSVPADAAAVPLPAYTVTALAALASDRELADYTDAEKRALLDHVADGDRDLRWRARLAAESTAEQLVRIAHGGPGPDICPHGCDGLYCRPDARTHRCGL
ncbi:hypothetical protein CU254_41835 (plasmid) [Amycolatopsis sp. AA4]|uniref:hypothetical protein n=1 Tax=Actinomycetes TaxID=1760 RepID=UPI0001B57141|nr:MULTISPECIES: hypothetical protein [Actinomycetes]ATY17121.1 hypothetical protein CU254_41835 [Amycolatopsis sp. AA4]